MGKLIDLCFDNKSDPDNVIVTGKMGNYKFTTPHVINIEGFSSDDPIEAYAKGKFIENHVDSEIKINPGERLLDIPKQWDSGHLINWLKLKGIDSQLLYEGVIDLVQPSGAGQEIADKVLLELNYEWESHVEPLPYPVPSLNFIE